MSIYMMHHYTPGKPVSDFANALPRPDLRNRASMIAFLLKHPRYGRDFCQNVKLYRLNIPLELLDNAYTMLEFAPHDHALGDLFLEFRKEWGDGSPDNTYGGVGNIHIEFDGRSAGYIVLKNAESDHNYEDFELGELRRVVRLVQAFDRLCDTAVNEFMYYVTEYRIEDQQVTETVTKTVRVLVES